MVKKIMMTLVLSALLNVSNSFAMENTNPGTVDRIVGIIRDFGIQEDNAETRDIILDALQGVMATDEEINQAFMKSESEVKQMSQEQKRRELTPTEKENAYKMWLIKKAMEKGTLPEVPTDVQRVIGETLHDVSANPVLNGELVYKDKGKETHFKIMDLVKKDGTFDLSNKEVFGNESEFLLITTDPEKFFSININSNRIVILIAPRFLIEAKLESTAIHFKPIMDKWKEDKAPIGIFWRMEKWDDPSWFDQLTSKNLIYISRHTLYENWETNYPATMLHPRMAERMHKISCLF